LKRAPEMTSAYGGSMAFIPVRDGSVIILLDI
jgi:hypothetical protein